MTHVTATFVSVLTRRSPLLHLVVFQLVFGAAMTMAPVAILMFRHVSAPPAHQLVLRALVAVAWLVAAERLWSRRAAGWWLALLLFGGALVARLPRMSETDWSVLAPVSALLMLILVRHEVMQHYARSEGAA